MLILYMLASLFYASGPGVIPHNVLNAVTYFDTMKSINWAADIHKDLMDKLSKCDKNSNLAGCAISLLYFFCERVNIIQRIKGNETLIPRYARWDLFTLQSTLNEFDLNNIRSEDVCDEVLEIFDEERQLLFSWSILEGTEKNESSPVKQVNVPSKTTIETLMERLDCQENEISMLKKGVRELKERMLFTRKTSRKYHGGEMKEDGEKDYEEDEEGINKDAEESESEKIEEDEGKEQEREENSCKNISAEMTKESSGINDVSKEILDVVKEIKDDIAKKDEKQEENEVNSENDEETESDAKVTEETVEMVETLAEMKNNIAKGSIERRVKAHPKRKKLGDPLFVYVEKMKNLKKPNDTSMEITVTEKEKMVLIDDDSDDEDFEDPPLEAGKMLNLKRCRNFKILTAEEKNIIMKDWYAYRKSDLVWYFQEEWINITIEQLEELLANSFVNGSIIDFFVWKLKKEGTERKFSYIHHFDCIQVVDACLLYAYDSNIRVQNLLRE